MSHPPIYPSLVGPWRFGENLGALSGTHFLHQLCTGQLSLASQLSANQEVAPNPTNENGRGSKGGPRNLVSGDHFLDVNSWAPQCYIRALVQCTAELVSVTLGVGAHQHNSCSSNDLRHGAVLPSVT